MLAGSMLCEAYTQAITYFFLLWVQKSFKKNIRLPQSETKRLMWLWETSRSSLSILHVIRKGRISPGFKQKSLFSRLRALQSCLKAICSLAKFSSAHWETSDAHNQSQELRDWLSVCGFRVLHLHLEHPLLVRMSSSPVLPTPLALPDFAVNP